MSTPFVRPKKASIVHLPYYDGLSLADIEVIQSPARAAEVAALLNRAEVVGFDTESKPRFHKGEPDTGPHLLQFALPERAFLFAKALPEVFQHGLAVCQQASVLKVGFGLKDDQRQLNNNHDTPLNNTLDLSRRLGKLMDDEKPIGARPAVAMLLGQQLSKSAQMSNWGRWPLSAKQIRYAGLDAHCALTVWQTLTQTPHLAG